MKIQFANEKILLSVPNKDNYYRFAYDVMQEFDINLKGGFLEIEKQDAIRLKEMIDDSNVEFSTEELEVLDIAINHGKRLREKISRLKTSTYDELNLDSEFKNFEQTILDKLNIDINDDVFGEITKKQITKVYAMSELENSLNFSEPGSGKTLMTLMNLVHKMEEDNKVIIVSPINSMNVWKAEIKKFLKSSNQDKMVHFFNEKMHSKFSDENKKDITNFLYAKFILINYESVQKISENETLMEPLINRGYHIVFDEAHRIKSGLSIRNIRSKKLSSSAISRTTLTGTPFSTSIDEIKQIIEVTWPNGNPFISNAKFDEYTSDINLREIENGISSIDELPSSTIKNIKSLSNDISPLYFNLSKVKDFDIEDANDNYDDPIVVKPLRIQRKLDSFISEKIMKINSVLANNTFPKFEKEKLEKIRNALYTAGEQNLVNPELLKEYHSFHKFFENEEEIVFGKLPKILATLEKVKELISKGKKVMIWFTFVKNITDFKDLLLNEGIIAEEIHGETPLDVRQKIIDDFSKPESKIQVLISNPATIAESISLHKSVSESIFVERTLSYFRWAQAKDRIHRVGSKDKVNHNYIKNIDLKIEQKIFDNLKKKDLLAKEIFTGSPFENVEAIQKLKVAETEDLNEVGIEKEERKYYETIKFSEVEEIFSDVDIDLFSDLEFNF